MLAIFFCITTLLAKLLKFVYSFHDILQTLYEIQPFFGTFLSPSRQSQPTSVQNQKKD